MKKQNVARKEQTTEIHSANERIANCDQFIAQKIYSIRGLQVMLDRYLAELYGVETKRLNEQVRRNIERFPDGFIFQLTDTEFANWKSQFATSNFKSQIADSTSFKMGLRHRPLAFTEHGITMLASVLKSQTAIQVSIQVVKAFIAMRNFMMSSAGVLQRIGAIEIKQLETDKRMETVFDALGRGNLLPNGLFPAESEFDAMRYVSRLVESAQTSIVLIDPYSDAVTLEVLAKKKPGVSVLLVCKDRGQPTVVEIAKFNRQYSNLVVKHSDKFHDRFLIVDNIELLNLGSSINCLGRRVTTYTTRDPKEIAKVVAEI